MQWPSIQARLRERETQGLMRRRKLVTANSDGMITIEGKACLNFASNDYLGLSQNQDVLQAYVEGLAQYGAGSTASSVVSGYMYPHQQLEALLCELFNKEAALLFNSGFAANQAICAALFEHAHAKNTSGHILCDKLMHASFIEGAMHTPAQLMRFRHNDMAHFAAKLDQCAGNTLIATEGVFSMDGDVGELAAILAILQSKQNSAQQSSRTSMLMLDDAHGFGVVGERGLGVSDLSEVDSDAIDITMATFGKAIGTSGAFVACSQDMCDYLSNFAKHYVYSTAIAPAQAVASMKSIEIMQNGPLRERLHANIQQFQTLALKRGLPLLKPTQNLGLKQDAQDSADDLNTRISSANISALVLNKNEYSQSAIQPVLVPNSQCLAVSQALLELGIYVPAIRQPTVPKGSERLRVTLSALHREQDIHALIDALCLVFDKHVN